MATDTIQQMDIGANAAKVEEEVRRIVTFGWRSWYLDWNLTVMLAILETG
jgi:hypothetical protein